MKKVLILLYFVLVSIPQLMAQQKVTFTIIGTPAAKMIPFYNKPENAGQITKGGIAMTFLLKNADNSKLSAIDFLDTTGHSKATLKGNWLKTAAAAQTFTITTDSGQQLLNVPGKLHIPFPFTIRVTYNQQPLSSGILGSLKPPSSIPNIAGTNLLTSGTKHTGVAYYDALAMANLIRTNQFGNLYTYLARFYFKDSLIKKEQVIAKLAANNPFFQFAFAQIKGGGEISSNSAVSGISIASLGNMDVSSLADGLAQFLVKRSEQELTAAFFDKFSIFINQHPDAKILFPATLNTLQTIGSQLYNYSAYLTSLRISFKKDISGLPASLPLMIKQGTCAGYFKQHGELRDATLSALFIADSLIHKEQPGKILADFDTDSLISARKDAGLKAGVQTLQLISASLRSAGKGHYWISSDSLKLLLKDPTALNLYLGIIFQQADSITVIRYKNEADTIGTAVSLGSLIPKVVDSAALYVTYIKNFIAQADILSGSIAAISSTAAEKPTFTEYNHFYTAALDLFQFAQKALQLPGLKVLPKINVSDKNFDQYFAIARAGGNLAFDLHQKSYGAMIIDVGVICNAAFTGTSKTSIQRTDWLKYGTFMASVAEAQNGTDVESAIEAIVLPAGSASIKRKKDFNIALNAYIGPYFGAEKIQNYDTRYTQSAGLTAPIGISASFGNAKFLGFIGKPGWSYSLFISVVDIGALASYRLTNNAVPLAGGDTAKTAATPTVQLKDIISPGAFLSIGIPKTPLSISGGFQLGPNLRTVTTGTNNTVTNTYAQKLYTRWSVSLVVDLPLLNLYTSSQ